MYDHTPFSWDEESKYISSKTVTVSVGDENTTNAAIPSRIKLPNKDLLTSAQTVQLAVPAEKNESTSQFLDNLNHTIYISNKQEPTKENNDWMKTIEISDWISSNEIKIIVDSGLYKNATLVFIGISIENEGIYFVYLILNHGFQIEYCKAAIEA